MRIIANILLTLVIILMSYITYQETFVMRKNSHWFENFVNFGFPYLLIAMLFLGVLIKTNYDD